MRISSFITDDGGPQVEYGLAAKYSSTFIDQINSLYLVSYLVTADRLLAERCLTRALDAYVEGRTEFLDWADLEGRRVVLREAIRMIEPAIEPTYRWTYQKPVFMPRTMGHQPFAAITSLKAFERFAFVMCSIEGLSEQESARLLNCTVPDVAMGRELARRIIEMEDVVVTGDLELFVVPTLLGDQLCAAC